MGNDFAAPRESPRDSACTVEQKSIRFQDESQNSDNQKEIVGSLQSLRRNHPFSQSDSVIDRDDYGWFEEIDLPGIPRSLSNEFSQQPLHRALTLPTPISETPLYVLESSLETQQLWYKTAGRRPKQPKHEREHFENLWKRNFESSSIDYASSRDRSKRVKNLDVVPKSEIQGEIIFRGKSPFSNSVSRSFLDGDIASITLHMPHFRIIKKFSGEEFAEFLIVVTITSHNSPVTFGIWKRFSQFSRLANLVSDSNLYSSNTSLFKNSILSWQCVLQRKRWYKSLDKDYLSLKCFLLERFMHDVLFECDASDMLVSFLGLDMTPSATASSSFFLPSSLF